MIKVKNIKFKKKVKINKILFFSSNWCFSCKKIKNNINKIKNKIILLFFYIDVDINHNYCELLKIKTIPNIKIVFNYLKEIKKFNIKNFLKTIIN